MYEVPRQSSASSPALAAKTNARRAAVLASLRRNDLVGTSATAKFCKLHAEKPSTGTGTAFLFPPLHKDPAFCGAVPGMRLGAVLEHKASYQDAISAATKRSEVCFDATHPGHVPNHPNSPAPDVRQAALLSPPSGTFRPLAPGSPNTKRRSAASLPGSPRTSSPRTSSGSSPRGSPAAVRASPLSSPHASPRKSPAPPGAPIAGPVRLPQAAGGDNINDRTAVREIDKHLNSDEVSAVVQIAKILSNKDEELVRMQVLLDKARAASAAKWHEPLSYELLTGKLAGRCHKHVVLPAGKLEALVKGCEIVGVDKVWAEVVEMEAKQAHRSSTMAEIGFRSAVCMALSRCKTGVNEDALAQQCGLADRRDVGVLFPATIMCVNEFLKATVALVPDLCQIDRDKLPAFNDPEFSNVMMTLDATNVVMDTPHNASGNKHSNSECYGGCHFKFEPCSDITGCPLWTSWVHGARGSEKGIVTDSNFSDFCQRFEKICVDEAGASFKPDIMADKGTVIRQLVESLGGQCFAPSQMAGGVDVTLNDIELNERMARARGHVERAIGRVKRFGMLTKGISHRLVPMIDDLLFFCVCCTHFV